MSAGRAAFEEQVVALAGRGLGQRRIACALGVSRGLVRRVLERRKEVTDRPHSALPSPPTRAPRASKLDAFEPRILDLLSAYPEITAQRILEELRAAGYDSGYSILEERVHRLRPPAPPEPSRVRPVVVAGEEAEQDWSPQRVGFADGIRTMHTFLLVLCFSRARYPDFFGGEDLFELLRLPLLGAALEEHLGWARGERPSPLGLLDGLYAGLADGSYDSRLARYARADLLVVDDVGLGRVRRSADEPTAAHMLFTLVDQRAGKRSTVVTSNIPLSGWGPYLGDPALTMAILDRLVEHATRMEIDGPSYRNDRSQKLNQRKRAALRPGRRAAGSQK